MRTDNQFNNLAEGTDEYLTPRRKTNTAEKFEEIKQKYARQLTKGCYKTYCTNILCTIDDDVRQKLYILDFLPRYGELFLCHKFLSDSFYDEYYRYFTLDGTQKRSAKNTYTHSETFVVKGNNLLDFIIHLSGKKNCDMDCTEPDYKIISEMDGKFANYIINKHLKARCDNNVKNSALIRLFIFCFNFVNIEEQNLENFVSIFHNINLNHTKSPDIEFLTNNKTQVECNLTNTPRKIDNYTNVSMKNNNETYQTPCFYNKELSSKEFIKLIDILKKKITELSENNIRTYRPLLAYLFIFRSLYKINDEHPIISYNGFYLQEFCKKISFVEEMQFLKKEGRSVFNYPFILPLNIKNRILKEQYSDKMKNSLKDAFFLSLFKGEVPPYLSLIVRRQYIYEDTVEQLDEAESLNKQLKISFDREEGVDVGGITREFFQLLSYQIVHERDLFMIKNEFIWPKIMNHGQFISESDQNLNLDYEFRFNYLKMNRNKEEKLKEYNYIGKIIALGLYNSFVLNIPFPLIFFKKLLGNEKYTLEDIEEIEPEIYNSLLKFRSFTDEEFHYMEQTFMITYSSDKNLYSKELVKNGRKIFVNRKNFDEFVTQYVHWIVHSSIEHSFNALKEGFYSIIDYETVRCLHPAEMEKILVGSFIVDLHFLRKHIEYVDYTADSNIVLWFWEIIEKYNTESLRKLLQFVTGNDKVPVINTAEWKIIITRNGCDTQRLPSSQTCFNTLLLPEYSSKRKLGEKLNIAIRYTKGFYLM